MVENKFDEVDPQELLDMLKALTKDIENNGDRVKEAFEKGKEEGRKIAIQEFKEFWESTKKKHGLSDSEQPYQMSDNPDLTREESLSNILEAVKDLREDIAEYKKERDNK